MATLTGKLAEERRQWLKSWSERLASLTATMTEVTRDYTLDEGLWPGHSLQDFEFCEVCGTRVIVAEVRDGHGYGEVSCANCGAPIAGAEVYRAEEPINRTFALYEI